MPEGRGTWELVLAGLYQLTYMDTSTIRVVVRKEARIKVRHC